MKPLTASELLTVWEQGANRPLLHKTLNLVHAACPELDMDTVAALSIGERDSRLLLLREWLFGPRFDNMATCPQCTEPIEWELGVEDVRVQSPREEASCSVREFTIEVDGFTIRFRLPNSIDLSSLGTGQSEAANPNPDPAMQLLQRCILEASHSGETCGADRFPDPVIQSIVQQMENEDPQSDIRMLIRCPQCAHQWDARFDIVSYFWEEIESWSQRMLQTVHLLAGVYHWSEKDILEMNPVRLQMYLGMVNG